ncbi:MAG: hypothetical protein K0S48_1560 [Ramlibacter sp.]|nr:hypothetical protein [Ramlibacter sp.]
MLLAEGPHGLAIRVPVLLRPGRPAPHGVVRRVEVLLQGFEQRMPPDRLRALPHVGHEVRAARAVPVQLVLLEVAPQDAQHLGLGRRHALVVHHLGVAQRPQLVLEGVGLHFLHRLVAAAQVHQPLHVQVEGVQGLAARRRIGAGGRRVVREEGVQRAQPDEGGALVRGRVAQAAQVAEVADAPVARGSQRIQLDGAAPPALAVPQARRHEAGARGLHDAAVLVRRGAIEGEAVVAGCQIGGQLDHRLLVAALQLPAGHAARPVLGRQLPGGSRAFVAGPAHRAVGAGAGDMHRRQAQVLCGRIPAVAGHRRDRALQHGGGDEFFLAPEAVVPVRHAEAPGLLRQRLGRQVSDRIHSVISCP